MPTFIRKRLHACWLIFLAVCLLAGWAAYLRQLECGFQVTGLSRQMSWGAYIAQFTFWVGVAAAAAVLTLPGRVHGCRPFARAAVFGEGLAAAATGMSLLCVLVDLGRPQHLLNLILHPSPRSLMFWDMLVLAAYLSVNLILVRATLTAERQDLPPPPWFRPLLTVSIGLALSIHVVTALIYAGLPDRHYWLTALLAARFLASAFSSGPAVLLLLLIAGRRLTGHDEASPLLPGLRLWIVYALTLNLLFFGLESFTALYSGTDAGRLFALLAASPGPAALAISFGLASVAAIILLAAPPFSRHPRSLIPALCLAVAAAWLDKGPLLMLGGFTPDPFGAPISYAPTLTELFVLLGIHAAGLLILTELWRPLFLLRNNAPPAGQNRPEAASAST
ncbi:MAG: polysulfide reductase NrfD [Deltaproteobacteria bacterium]|jgi:molybdopterin-containing oxidoreductase family membrane subunit|nr:polysulfide reductase NrfD [Deltaproteobacteria bacterium]